MKETIENDECYQDSYYENKAAKCVDRNRHSMIKMRNSKLENNITIRKQWIVMLKWFHFVWLILYVSLVTINANFYYDIQIK